ncbi:MAG: rane protein insertase YidC [Bacteroidota bacterium]|jgi:YidC/Oxa1 family membrane protein insertase
MDRKTLIGFLLMFLMIFGYLQWTSKNDAEIALEKRKQDSIANLNKPKLETKAAAAVVDTSKNDTAKTQITNATFVNITNEEKVVTLENDLMIVKLTNVGGSVKSVELKKFKTYEKKSLQLVGENEMRMQYAFYTAKNELVKTGDLKFELISSDPHQVVFALKTANGGEFRQIYALKDGEYRVDYHVELKGMAADMGRNMTALAVNWNQSTHLQEKSVEIEQPLTTAYYHYTNDDFDHLSETSKDVEEEKPATPLRWIALKQKFFSTAILTDNQFTDSKIKQELSKEKNGLKDFQVEFMLPVKDLNNTAYSMKLFFGPNNYNMLKSYDNGMEKLVTLSGGLFKWFGVKAINRFLIIPVFNFLNEFNLNFGLIILIIVIIIKLILWPLNYRTFVSAAKTRILKPEVDALRAKYKDDQAKLGMEQMRLNRKAGVNPLAGCLPQLLQLPVLVAMYYFFPSSIELRQQSFLWADDLSSYDSIINFGFKIWLLGDHLSLFTLLMTITTYASIYLNRNQNPMSDDPNMAVMKYMQYIFPIMFLGIFNNSPAALAYYYLLQNLTSIIQQWVIQKLIINEDKLRAEIQENMKRPEAKKTGFMARLEEAQRIQQQQAKNKKK